jgi:signal transduction histidine kinase/ligand-binding sensor domain-containing protein
MWGSLGAMASLPSPWLIVGLAAFGAAPPGPSMAMAALDPSVRISQYAHTAWRVRDGLFSSVPEAVGQTTDGYLWIGTDAGLVRFDGVRFVPWSPPPDTPLPSSAIYSLLGARDGSLWIGTASGPAHWTDGRLVRFPEVVGRVNAILEDDDGSIWIARTRLGAVQGLQGVLCRFHQDAFRCFGRAEGIAGIGAQALAKDTGGAIWFGGPMALTRWKADHAANYLERELAPNGAGIGIGALAARRDGGIWVGFAGGTSAFGLRQFVDGSSARYSVPGMDASALSVSRLLVDGNDSLWVGTEDEGLYRVAGGRAEHFRGADGLSSDTVIALHQDREGSLWVATSKGIDRLRDYRVMTLSAREGLTSDHVGSVLATADGAVWMGSLNALELLRGGTVASITRRQGLPGSNVTSLFEDRRGRMWVGVDNGLFAYDGGRFRSVKSGNGSPLGLVIAMTDDSDHNLWAEVVGPRPGLVRIRDLEEREYIPRSTVPYAHVMAPDPHDGIWLGLENGKLGRYSRGRFEAYAAGPGSIPGGIRGLLVDPDGPVWSVSSAGLTRWQDGVARTLDDRQGLPCRNVFSLVRDDRRALWLYAGCGLVRIAANELDRWSAGSGATVQARTFDVLDGAQPSPAVFQPAASRSPDGRLWFANSAFLQSVDPGHLLLDERPPPVHVEQLVADGKVYDARNGHPLPALTREVRLDYAAPTFVIPERVKFRYKLEGKDRGWQEPGTRRQAFYNDLPPGPYRFRVLASNHDGVWNEAGATLDFSVAPAYFQTVWFRAGVTATAIAMLWMLYLLRLRQLTAAAEARMQARLAERERIAREVHDTLLQGLNGLILKFQSIADRMPPSEPARAMMNQALDRADQAVSEGRSLVEGLRAPDRDGIEIVNTLREIGSELARDGGATLKVIVEGRPHRLHVVVGEEVYWVAREALINAFHAARATQIELELSYGRRELRLRVRDDGTGIDPAVLRSGGRPGHWGIRGMKERAARIRARLEISSRPGAGTEVDLRVAGVIAYRPDDGTPRRRWLAWPFEGAAGGRSLE